VPEFFGSRALRRADYDAASQRLTIVFRHGKSYDYCRVPVSVWEGLLNAGSKGTYFNDHIADRYHC